MEYTFKNMKKKHKKAIVDIYNYYVENSFAAYPTTIVGEEIFTRFKAMTNGYPAKVIINNKEEVVGFAFLRAYHNANSFNKTAEITYFIAPEHTRKGLATKVLDEFKKEARETGIKNILASISSFNDESINFHKKHGFIECGRFKNIGTKFDKDFDVIWMQLVIEDEE